MKYYIYQITNHINHKIYIGVHQTDCLDDGYMGSGKIIKRAIVKYGIENFSKQILEFFDDRESMYAREKQIVTEEFIARSDTYNIRRGGFGGFEYINTHPELFLTEKRLSALMDITETRKLWKAKYDTDETFQRQVRERLKAAGDKSRELHGSPFAYLNKDHNFQEKRRARFKELNHSVGTRNSQYGTMWITDGNTNSKVPKTADIPDGWRKGRVCGKTNNHI